MDAYNYDLKQESLDAARTFRNDLRQAWENRPADLPPGEMIMLCALILSAHRRAVAHRREMSSP